MSNERSKQEIRTRPRGVRMPEPTSCDNCGLTYYQTTAPHVCAEWTRGAKENQIMNTSIDKWCECQHALYNHGEDDFSPQKCNVIGCECENFAPTTGHEPVARGGEGAPDRIQVCVRAGKGDWIGVAYHAAYTGDPSTIHEYVSVNQHHSLLAERDNLRRLLKAATSPTRCYCDVMAGNLCWQCEARAALNDQKGE